MCATGLRYYPNGIFVIFDPSQNQNIWTGTGALLTIAGTASDADKVTFYKDMAYTACGGGGGGTATATWPVLGTPSDILDGDDVANDSCIIAQDSILICYRNKIELTRDTVRFSIPNLVGDTVRIDAVAGMPNCFQLTHSDTGIPFDTVCINEVTEGLEKMGLVYVDPATGELKTDSTNYRYDPVANKITFTGIFDPIAIGMTATDTATLNGMVTDLLGYIAMHTDSVLYFHDGEFWKPMGDSNTDGISTDQHNILTQGSDGGVYYNPNVLDIGCGNATNITGTSPANVGEVIQFEFTVPEDGSYTITERLASITGGVTASHGAGLGISLTPPINFGVIAGFDFFSTNSNRLTEALLSLIHI